MASSNRKIVPSQSLSAAAAVLVGLAAPSAASACSLCVDAASRVTMPGVLDAGRVFLLFFVASTALAVFGRISGGDWRLGSKLYWLVGAAAVIGSLVAAKTGLILAAGLPLMVVSLMRIYRAAKLSSLSTHELLAGLLAGLFVVAGPAAFLIGNQRASSLDYLFASLASRHPVTAREALIALQAKGEAGGLACERIEGLGAGSVSGEEARPMEWFGLLQLADGKGSCPEAVLSLQRLCDFPDGARMDVSLTCAGRPKAPSALDH